MRCAHATAIAARACTTSIRSSTTAASTRRPSAASARASSSRRSGWAGSQRCPMQWGGDPQSDWGGLAGCIRGMLSWAASGGAWLRDRHRRLLRRPARRRAVRPLGQAAVFASHMRFHGIGAREPWSFGERGRGPDRAALELRYRLIPYIEAAWRRPRDRPAAHPAHGARLPRAARDAGLRHAVHVRPRPAGRADPAARAGASGLAAAGRVAGLVTGERHAGSRGSSWPCPWSASRSLRARRRDPARARRSAHGRVASP